MPLPNDPGREPWEIDHHDLDAVRDCGASGETQIFEPADGRLPLVQLPVRGRVNVGAASCDVQWRAQWRRGLADGAYAVLCTVGWLIDTVLGVLGCAVVVFIVLGHGQWDAFFLHIDNLAARYIDADTARRAKFARDLTVLFSILLAVSLVWRGPRFVRRLRRDIASGPRQ